MQPVSKKSSNFTDFQLNKCLLMEPTRKSHIFKESAMRKFHVSKQITKCYELMQIFAKKISCNKIKKHIFKIHSRGIFIFWQHRIKKNYEFFLIWDKTFTHLHNKSLDSVINCEKIIYSIEKIFLLT